MSLLKLISQQIKKNLRAFTFVNLFFLIFIFFFINFFKNEKLVKHNYQITLNYNKNLILQRFDITSFAQKSRFQIIKKNKIYLEKKLYLKNKDIYYFYIISDKSNNADKIFENIFNEFKDNYLQNTTKEIRNLEKKVLALKKMSNDIFFLIDEELNISLNYNLNLDNEAKYDLFNREIKKSQNKLINLKKEIFKYKILNKINYNDTISLNHDKFSLLFIIFLVLNFLILFKKK